MRIAFTLPYGMPVVNQYTSCRKGVISRDGEMLTYDSITHRGRW